MISDLSADMAGPLLCLPDLDDPILTYILAFGGSWADEVEETVGTQALPPMERRGGGGGGNSFYNSSGPRTDDRGMFLL